MAQFLVNCTSLSLAQLSGRNLARSLSALVCFFLTLVILVLLVLYRSYKTLLQRLFLYLTIIILVHQAFISLDIQLQFDWKYGSVSCKVQGFIRSWTATATYFIIVAVTAHLMHLVCRQLLWSKSSEKCNCWTSNKIRADIVIVLSCLLLPLTYLWIPFYHGTYGIHYTTCWIQKVNLTCHKLKVGNLDEIICSTVMRAIMVSVSATILTLFLILCKSSVHYNKINSVRMRMKLKQTFFLMSFFLASFVVEGSGLGMYIYSAVSGKEVTSSGFWVAYDIAMPFSQLIIPIGLLVNLHSLKKESLKRALREWKQCCTNVLTKKRQRNDQVKMFKDIESREHIITLDNVQSPPSSTHFDIEYTGAFTSITEQCTPTRNYGSFRAIETATSKSEDKKLSSCGLENTINFSTRGLYKKKHSQRNTGICAVKCSKELRHPKYLEEYEPNITENNSDDIQESIAMQNCNTCSDVNKQSSKPQDIKFAKSLTTVEPNGCVSPPSTTYFSIEYTGEFTSIVDHY